MSDTKFNFSNLKKQIEEQKQAEAQKAIQMGQQTGAMMKSNKRAFLSELKSSLINGTPNNATQVINTISTITEAKHGAPIDKKYNPPVNQAPRQEYVPPVPQGNGGAGLSQALGQVAGLPSGSPAVPMMGDGERDSLYEQRMNAGVQRMLSNLGHNTQPPQYIPQQGQPQYLNEQQVMQQYYQQQQQMYGIPQPQGQVPYVAQPQTPMMMNEAQQKLMFEHMERSAEKLMETAFKNVLTTIFANEKMEAFLNEYAKTDKFKHAVSEVVIELAKRQAQKAKENKK